MPKLPSEAEILARGGRVIRGAVKLPKGKRPRNTTLEDWFLALWRETKVPMPVREHPFAPPRKWRFDFAWPNSRVAVEIEGGQFTRRPCPQCRAMIPVGGGHHGSRFGTDTEKYSIAAILGWKVLRFSGEDLRHAGQWVKDVVCLALRMAALKIDPGDATSCQNLVASLQRPQVPTQAKRRKR